MTGPVPRQPDDPEYLGSYEVIGRLREGGQGVVLLGGHQPVSRSPSSCCASTRGEIRQRAPSSYGIWRWPGSARCGSSTSGSRGMFDTAETITGGVPDTSPIWLRNRAPGGMDREDTHDVGAWHDLHAQPLLELMNQLCFQTACAPTRFDASSGHRPLHLWREDFLHNGPANAMTATCRRLWPPNLWVGPVVLRPTV